MITSHAITVLLLRQCVIYTHFVVYPLEKWVYPEETNALYL